MRKEDTWYIDYCMERMDKRVAAAERGRTLMQVNREMDEVLREWKNLKANLELFTEKLKKEM